MSVSSGAPRLLHLFSRFSAQEPAARRAVAVMNGLGGRIQHMIATADRGATDAAHGLHKGIGYTVDTGFRGLDGWAGPGRLQRLARRFTAYDLVLSYGKDALLAPVAHTLFAQHLNLPPLIHHDDGADETPRQRRGFRSLWFRRVGLGKASGLVVPTETMEGVALTDWRQPMGRVKLIRDGVDLARFSGTPKPDAIPRLIKRNGELWAVCFAGHAAPWSLTALIAGFDKLPYDWHLILVGGGIDNPEISRRDLDDRVHLAPSSADPATLLGLSDMVLQAAGPEPLARETLWAIAAGRPLAGYETGDIAMTAPDNAQFLLPASERYTPVEAMTALADDADLRRRLGKANRAQAEKALGEAAMLSAYRRLYTSAIEWSGR